MQSEIRAVCRVLVLLSVLPHLPGLALAQGVSQYAIQVSATVQAEPAQITLSWPAVEGVRSHAISRRLTSDQDWGNPVLVPEGATSYVDSSVVSGQVYEYQVARTAVNYKTHAYISAGFQIPLVESRGKVLLLVDRTQVLTLAAELARLEQDLVGDGWVVSRHDVARMTVAPAETDPGLWLARSNEVTQIKRLIQGEYRADPANVRAVFLVGHVPVPYSGILVPDQHFDHRGAWPADVFYGDMDGVWTDSSVKITTGSDPRTHNLPGDGKFDQSTTAGPVRLEVGRIDMANLSGFPLGEDELMRQYLNKDHDFRHRRLIARSRALVNDNLGVLGGEVPALNGWENFAPLVGSANVTEGRWLTDLVLDDYLWAYGCGAGSYNSAAGVVDTLHFLVYDPKAIFTMLFGSYFGDWDSENNLLRAPLAMSSYTLTSVWGGRPNWFVHPMGLGETIGFSARLTQNNTGVYRGYSPISSGPIIAPSDADSLLKGVHVALMGDPTLRMQPVAPPLDLGAVANAAGGVELTWNESLDPVLGYHVYRAAAAGGPFSRITSALVNGRAYIDEALTAESYYMVRAIKLEISSSGTYTNASQGAFAQAPVLALATDETIWGSRGVRSWRIDDARGTAGSSPGWDHLQIEAPLNITASSSNQFTVRIVSSSGGGLPGAPTNFNSNSSYTWPLLTSSAGVTGFDLAKIRFLTSEFAGDLEGGTFSLALTADEKSISLLFTPNQPPVTSPAFFTRDWDRTLKIDIAELLEKFTRDPDGDARALVAVGASTNGTTITSDGTSLVFTPTDNVREIIHYWVQDVRAYRPGDTVRVAEGTITIQPIPEALPFSAYHAIEINWQGEPGQRYQVQSRLQTGADWVNEGEPFIATGERTSLFERANNETKFYRIIVVK